jgi:transketolase
MPIKTRDVNELIEKSKWLRREQFELVMKDKIGHFPSSSAIAEICISLFYGGILKYDPSNPEWEDRDRFIISQGHAGMAIYPILAELGFFPKEELEKFARADGILRFYPDHNIPGFETISGSLGHGVGVAAGYSLIAKRDNKSYNSFVIISDGECYEGSTTESARFAAHYNLDNLIVVLNRNKCIILGETENCLKLEPLEEEWRSYGWNTHQVDGHSYTKLFDVFDKVLANKNGKPTIIIADTLKGKGVSFMEGNFKWHNRMPDDKQESDAREELKFKNPIYE